MTLGNPRCSHVLCIMRVLFLDPAALYTASDNGRKCGAEPWYSVKSIVFLLSSDLQK